LTPVDPLMKKTAVHLGAYCAGGRLQRDVERRLDAHVEPSLEPRRRAERQRPHVTKLKRLLNIARGRKSQPQCKAWGSCRSVSAEPDKKKLENRPLPRRSDEH